MARDFWRLLGKYVHRRGPRLFLLSLFSLLAGVLEAVVLVLTVRAAVTIADHSTHVDFTTPILGRNSLNVAAVLWIAAGAGVLSALAGVVVSQMTARLSADVLSGIRAVALRSFSRASWDHQAASREGSLQETVSNHAMQSSELVIAAGKALSALLGVMVLLLASVVVSAVVTLAVVGIAVAISQFLRPITRRTRRSATHFVDENTRFGETVAEASGLALEMRVFGVEVQEAERLVQASERASEQAFSTRYSSYAGATLYRNATILFLVVAVAGLYAVGDADLSAVGAVVVLMVRTLSYLQQTQSNLQRMNELSPNLAALDARIMEMDAAREVFGTADVAEVRDVSLRGVSYRYGDQAALHDIDLDLAFGETLGIVGPSGGGKSTLVQVLLRLRPPTTGVVLVDGRPYDEISPEAWASLVSLVPQEPHLFSGTVADNIAFHRPGVTRDQIVAAAKRAYVADEIEAMAGGFDAVLGPRGAGLSGGQRQRLAIARALVGEPNLLVLDEPTSALDVHSERMLQKTIAELTGRVTMVIVAHRLSTIAACERLLVLEQGRVAALGPNAEVQRHPFLARAAGPSAAAH
jgi:ABC-type multidrug transport system fused ATPase/permease subunit